MVQRAVGTALVLWVMGGAFVVMWLYLLISGVRGWKVVPSHRSK